MGSSGPCFCRPSAVLRDALLLAFAFSGCSRGYDAEMIHDRLHREAPVPVLVGDLEGVGRAKKTWNYTSQGELLIFILDPSNKCLCGDTDQLLSHLTKVHQVTSAFSLNLTNINVEISDLRIEKQVWSEQQCWPVPMAAYAYIELKVSTNQLAP
jgi:hypothetical protein